MFNDQIWNGLIDKLHVIFGRQRSFVFDKVLMVSVHDAPLIGRVKKRQHAPGTKQLLTFSSSGEKPCGETPREAHREGELCWFVDKHYITNSLKFLVLLIFFFLFSDIL